MKSSLRTYTMVTVLLVLLLLLQPFCTTPRIDPLFGRGGTALAAPLRDDTVFLPIIAGGGPPSVPSGDPPTFVINSPVAGSSVGGTTFFSIQPTNGAPIDTVTFRAGTTNLGSDNDGSNGFRVFLDARTQSAGATQLTATASNTNGETSQSINVTIVPNPPQSATVGSSGAVLASEIGSVIALLPGSVPAGTTVTIDELTQAETTERHGIDWESMGVTFLGAQDVQSSVPISGPFGMVSSAGFGNRVQPGQAVVNYRIAPDADGDGVDEIVVVNTATVAPNGDVIADPIPPVTVDLQATLASAALAQPATISGPPGKFIEFAVSGFNQFSLNGNVAHFRALNSNYEIQVAGSIEIHNDDFSQQYFRVALPYFPPGPASVVLLNQSTGMASEPFTLEIEPLPALSRSAEAIIFDYYDAYLAILAEAKTTVMSDDLLKDVILDDVEEAERNIQQSRGAMQQVFAILQADPAPEVSIYLDDFARMVEVAGLLTAVQEIVALAVDGDGCTPPTLDKKGLADDFTGFMPFGTYIFGTASPSNSSTTMEVAQNVANATGRGNLGTAIGGASTGLTAGGIITRLFNNINDGLQYANNVSQGKCDDAPPPAPSQPSNNNNNGGGNGGRTTGMGAAPPSGGNGFGGAGGGGGSRQLIAAATRQQTSPIMIKVFINGRATPFTGMTDPGGYFFVPFLPADEPFTALAIDTATGASRSFKGIGPKTGQSAYMFFNFYLDDGSGATSIQLDEVIAGEITTANEQDLYSFTATAGQQIFFDQQSHDNTLNQIDWQLLAPDGSTIFNTCLGCGDPGVKRLTLPGTYILSVGEVSKTNTGAYQFKLWNVPAADEFTIAIDDTVADGVPGAGAGRIESPGVQDIYRFSATAGQRIFVDQQGATGLPQINWQLEAPNGTVIFDSCLGCGDPGVKTLPEAGTYVLTVGDDRDASTGAYQFKLWNVPAADEFTIAIDDTVADGVPGAGAGRIETPGVQDIYRFSATAGQRIFVDQQGATGVAQINWKIEAPNGTVIFDTCLGCGDPGVQTLPEAGTYVLTVGDSRDASTGAYQFKLWNVPAADEFTIAIGDVISDSVPGLGAGRIETPGTQDIYRFTATAGQQVLFDQQGNTGVSQIDWKLEAPNGIVLFDTCLGCGDPSVQTLVQAGTYVLTVGDLKNDSTGTYRFQIVEQ